MASSAATDRVLADIAELARLSDAGPGVTRLAYTERDAEARAWFARRAVDLGMEVEVDAYGNSFAWSPGARLRPAILLGSHLDSVKEAGSYDGVLGVVVGFEIAREVMSGDPDAAIGVVAFGCEESIRFGIGAVGSRLLVGDLTPDSLATVRDLEGERLCDVLRHAGLDRNPAVDFGPERVACFLEVHIDQGSMLGRTAAIGIVPAIAGDVRLHITWIGEASHSGAHARAERRDALLAAARFVTAADRLWAKMDERGDATRITVGWLENHPNSPNSVAGRCEVVVDLRAPDAAVLARARDDLERLARAAATGLAVEVDELGWIAPAAMAPELVEMFELVAGEIGVESRLTPSMAGHDAEVIAPILPTAMVFVANPACVSHNPAEALDERSLTSALALLSAAVPQLSEASQTRPRGAQKRGVTDRKRARQDSAGGRVFQA